MGKYPSGYGRGRYGRTRSGRESSESQFEMEHASEESSSSHRGQYKDAQIAKLALRVLDQEVGSWDLAISWGLSVVHVECLARGTNLVVIIASSRADVDAREVSAWLDEHAGAMRSALARVLARKRVPGLSVQYAGARAVQNDIVEEQNEQGGEE